MAYGLTLITPPAEEPIPLPPSGVYCITCTPTQKVYIGSAARIQKRWNDHRNDLRNQEHSNRHLQRAWNKYGESAFTFEVLTRTDLDDLLWVEQAFMDVCSATDSRFGFNICPVAGSPRGRKLTEAQRAHLSAVCKGRVISAETRAKISAAQMGRPGVMKGRRHTPATIEKLKAVRVGRKPSLGMRHSDALKAATSARFKGKSLAPEHRAKIAAAHVGKKHTAQHSASVSAAQARFDNTQVARIRERAASGENKKVIARELGVSVATIYNVLNRAKQAYQ